jgi:hypothetical protein
VIETPARRLNYGCGYDKREGYVNVDSDPVCQPDLLIVDNDLSPLAGQPFDEVLALDVLEHIPRTQTPGILLEWNDLLATGGRLVLKTSSILGVARQLAHEPSFREQYGWVLCLFGTQAHPGDFHLTGFTETTLRVHLLAAGFRVDRVWLTDRWLLHAEATKAESWTDLVSSSAAQSHAAFVEALYRAALDRSPQPHEVDTLVAELDRGQRDRRAVCRHVYSGAERLFTVAERHGFEPSPSASFIDAVRSRTPAALRPPLRTLRMSTRSALGHVRRAAGARRRPRSRF